jgi:hypothetical protein
MFYVVLIAVLWILPGFAFAASVAGPIDIWSGPRLYPNWLQMKR